MRHTCIGGSEISAVLGKNKYTSPYRLWSIKTGRSEYTADEDAPELKVGRHLESGIFSLYVDELKKSGTLDKVAVHSEGHYSVAHPLYSWVRVYPDREVYLNTGERIVVEIKNTQRQVDKTLLPDEWYLQVQYEIGTMKAAGIDIAYGVVVWLERGVYFDYLEVDFDEDLYENILLPEAENFWQNFVLADVEPPVTTEDDLGMKYPFSKVSSIVATPEIEKLYVNLKDAKETLKNCETLVDSLSLEVKKFMGDNDAVIVQGGQRLFTWKNSKPRVTVDSKKLLAEFPEVYTKVLKQTPVRPFVVK